MKPVKYLLKKGKTARKFSLSLKLLLSERESIERQIERYTWMQLERERKKTERGIETDSQREGESGRENKVRERRERERVMKAKQIS